MNPKKSRNKERMEEDLVISIETPAPQKSSSSFPLWDSHKQQGTTFQNLSLYKLGFFTNIEEKQTLRHIQANTTKKKAYNLESNWMMQQMVHIRTPFLLNVQHQSITTSSLWDYQL